jgi:iron uptake system component EfeO
MCFSRLPLLALGFASALACSSSSSSPGTQAAGDGGGPPLTDDQYAAQVTTAMHDSLLKDVNALYQAATDLQNAAPTPSGRGWNATQDAAAITAMKNAWVQARNAYEHVEGAFVPLFPDIDNSLDARYDDFMSQLVASGGDPYLFDDKGVTGLHAVERILYFDVTPQRVVDFERVLPGYVAARFPSTAQEASDFKTKLCAKVLADAGQLRDLWTPEKIKIAIAFQGLISLMNEQREKVTKAASNEEESRYSQRTMADIRDNLDGTTTIYAVFQPWLLSKSDPDPSKDGKTIDGKITAGFQALGTAYGAVTGDAIPEPPSTWSVGNPSPADLATPFGQLYSKVRAAVDPNSDSGIVYQMNHAAAVLGFPQFQQQ